MFHCEVSVWDIPGQYDLLFVPHLPHMQVAGRARPHLCVKMESSNTSTKTVKPEPGLGRDINRIGTDVGYKTTVPGVAFRTLRGPCLDHPVCTAAVNGAVPA